MNPRPATRDRPLTGDNCLFVLVPADCDQPRILKLIGCQRDKAGAADLRPPTFVTLGVRGQQRTVDLALTKVRCPGQEICLGLVEQALCHKPILTSTRAAPQTMSS